MTEPEDRETRDIIVGPAPVVGGTRFYTDSWAVIVGINQYRSENVRSLSCAVNDADSVERTIHALGFPPERIIKRLNEEATRTEIERIFESELFKRTESEDRILFFFAGHGETVETGYGREGFILPWDADPDELAHTALSMPAFRQMARRLKAKHVLLVADACYSGGFASRSISSPSKLLQVHLEERAIEVITAGTARQQAVEEGEHGIFTRNFLSALHGAADEAGVGYLTAMQLAAWLQPRVTRDTEGGQHPTYGSLEGNGQFVFVLPEAGARVEAPPRAPPIKEPERPSRPRIKKVRLTGKIAVRSDIEGELSLDGESLGDTIGPGEVAELEDIPVGQHEVSVEGESGTASQTVLVRENETSEVHLEAQIRVPNGLVPVKGCGVDPASSFPFEVICETDGAPMVLVPAGEFLMGSADNDPDALEDEKPQRRVHLDAFYIDKYPVTNEQYGTFLKESGHKEPVYWGDFKWNGPMQPVVGVSWKDAVAYCEWAGKRLPTEAEWEKAARGVDGRKYPWGSDWDGSKVIWSKNSSGKTHPVDRDYNTHRSSYGAVDMAGNTWEWVSDWYGEDYYRNAPDRNPAGPSSGGGRVVRGGSWNYVNTGYFRAALRNRFGPESWTYFVSFRCAKASNSLGPPDVASGDYQQAKSPNDPRKSKYDPLYFYLQNLEEDEWRASFDEIERILGSELPFSARNHQAWWANERNPRHPQKLAWHKAGWHTTELNLTGEKIVFRRGHTR